MHIKYANIVKKPEQTNFCGRILFYPDFSYLCGLLFIIKVYEKVCSLLDTFVHGGYTIVSSGLGS